MLKKIDVNGERHAAIGVLLLFVKMLAGYVRCLDAMPLVATEVLRKLFELLKVFNSQVRSLWVNGGGGRHVCVRARARVCVCVCVCVCV